MAKPDKYLLYSPKEIRAVATYEKEVVFEIDMPDAGLMPGVTVAFRMSPDEARTVAQYLLRSAGEAEAGPVQ